MPEFLTNPSVDPWMLSSFSGLKTKQNVLCTTWTFVRLFLSEFPEVGFLNCSG